MAASETTTHQRVRSLAVCTGVLGALLQAHKSGELDRVRRRCPRLFRQLRARWLQPVIGSMGAWGDADGELKALVLFARWGLAQLRPDGQPQLDGISAQNWLDRTSWRPVLVMMCHFGFASVPAFPERYRAHASESAVDRLCGLWSVGASTCYRYLEKGKRQFVQQVMLAPWTAQQMASLRSQSAQTAREQLGLTDAQLDAWHDRQAQEALAQGDLPSCAWHRLAARDWAQWLTLLEGHSAEFAGHAETEALLTAADALPLSRSQQVERQLLEASLWRARNAPARELACLEQARRLATQPSDERMLGLVYGALGKHFEARDAERALAYYEDSSQYLSRAIAAAQGEVDAKTGDGYVKTLVSMAWQRMLKKDPRALGVLETAQQLLPTLAVAQSTEGLLEQALGEYWRRAGNTAQALRHKHRALNIFERIEDLAQRLSSYNNLCLLYCETQEFERACDYAQKVIDLARSAPVDPYLLASSHGNLGIALLGLNKLDAAIEAYRAGLAVCESAGLATLVGRACYNLAEAHYRRFAQQHDPNDEREGDAFAAASFKVWAAQKDKAFQSATASLKREVLGGSSLIEPDRLMHEEFVAHFDELRDIKQHRAALALPGTPVVHVQAHLAIAQAYLDVANKEREAAKALIAKHGLGDVFAGAFEQLHAVFHREQSSQERLLVQWQAAATDLLGDERRLAVIDELLRVGHINKSGYARVGHVALATASKHLGLLAERGLLVQTGKGPATRYLLPNG
jgi:tetratricopeptide (TPR) repeat protein